MGLLCQKLSRAQLKLIKSAVNNMSIDRRNNFDLIRLIAAAQVVFLHAAYWLQAELHPLVSEVLDWFPGVPIFFMVSGYLITASFVNTKSVKEFAYNRFLRIFPGLWVCLFLTLLMLLIAGQLQLTAPIRIVAWLASQGTFLQFFGGGAFPAFGNGSINGALWSIATELQFYLWIPIVALAISKLPIKLNNITALIFIMGFYLLSCVFHAWILGNAELLHPKLFALMLTSVLSYGYLFLIGVAFYYFRELIIPFLRDKFLLLLMIYFASRSLLYSFGALLKNKWVKRHEG